MNTLIDLKLVHNKVTFWNPVPDSQFLFSAETPTIFTVKIFSNPGALSELTIQLIMAKEEVQIVDVAENQNNTIQSRKHSMLQIR